MQTATTQPGATYPSTTHPWVAIPADMPAFMVDRSWRNDECPRFESEGGISLWVDAKDPEKRWEAEVHGDEVWCDETGAVLANKRFSLGVMTADDWLPILDTDSWTLARGVLCLAQSL